MTCPRRLRLALRPPPREPPPAAAPAPLPLLRIVTWFDRAQVDLRRVLARSA